MQDIDVWRTAGLMVKRYGKDAVIESAKRADDLMAVGDLDGQRVWLRVLKAIEELTDEKPSAQPN